MSVSNAWKIHQIYTFKWPQFYSSYWSLFESLTTFQHWMSNDVLWCMAYNYPRQHFIQRQKTNCFLFISYKLRWLNATWHKSWICLYPKCRCKVSKLKLPHPDSLLSYSHPQSSNFFYFLISKNIGVIVLWLLNFPHLELAQTPKEATKLVTSAKTVTQVKFPCSMCLQLNQQS